MKNGDTVCKKYKTNLYLALAACLLLGMPGIQPASAAGVAAPPPAISTFAAGGAPTSALVLLSQPHQPGLFTHRADGWPRAALLLIFVVISQILILAIRRLFRRR